MLCFVICFINWLSVFRLTLDPAIRNQNVLLIFDGHKSREYTIAIKMLKDHNVSLLILPPHTSHLTRIFDVGIGSPMKNWPILKQIPTNQHNYFYFVSKPQFWRGM